MSLFDCRLVDCACVDRATLVYQPLWAGEILAVFDGDVSLGLDPRCVTQEGDTFRLVRAPCSSPRALVRPPHSIFRAGPEERVTVGEPQPRSDGVGEALVSIHGVLIRIERELKLARAKAKCA